MKKSKINWRRTWKNNCYMLGLICKACPWIFVMNLLATVLGVLNNFLFNTYLYKYALNALQRGEELKRILMTLGLMLVYSIAYMVFRAWFVRYNELHYPKVEAYIQNLMQKKSVAVELACFERPEFYDTYVKAMGGATDRAFTVMNNFTNVVWVVLNVLSVGTLIITIDPVFLVFAFTPLLFTMLLGRHRNRIKYEYNMKNREAGRKKDYVRRTFYLKDFSMEMRLTDMWRVMLRQMRESVEQLKDIVREYGYTLMWFAYLFNFIFDVVVYTGSIILAAYKTVVKKNMLLGDCFVIINSISNIAQNINYAGDVILKLDEDSLYIDNLRAFLEYDVQIKENITAPQVPQMQTLTFSNVSFTYDGQKNAALEQVDLTICAGERVAIVGHNGAGKSTLIKLLLRLYDPTEGEVLLNGENIKNWRLSSYRDLYGTVFQDYQLFATSIAENILLREVSNCVDEELVEDSLKNSGISEKVHTLSHGIHTMVTREFADDGVVFSGGEAQKISIARVFAGNHEIVILDEPTSALDPIAEQAMYRNMFDACSGKTVIFISHRLSSATMADRVYLFEHGRIKEQGTHSELLAKNGIYADMWHKQADSYSSEFVNEVNI